MDGETNVTKFFMAKHNFYCYYIPIMCLCYLEVGYSSARTSRLESVSNIRASFKMPVLEVTTPNTTVCTQHSWVFLDLRKINFT